MSASEKWQGAKRRIAKIGVACKRTIVGPGEIEAGPAKGLRFDAGDDSGRFAQGDYELPVQQALAALVHPGDVCYDIGANLGFFSVLLARLVGPDGSVFAFEPVPANVSMIERNARLNDLTNIRVMPVALTRDDGEAELLLARHVGGAVLKSAGSPPDLAGSLMVQTASADSLIARLHLASPNFVKIDVEGAEMDVLVGMEVLLREKSPIVVLELDDEKLEACETKVAACRRFLEYLGYETADLPNSYRDGRWFVRHFCAQRRKA
ncbi:MAG: FkbM family methyltransferase [Sterolibacteriaceae bacterium]|nr:FkbM family methyltransferase [Sterolibacteriaceae bacterium]MBK9085338.1 FkbM family methyltransferase [Sterolibacteriaceae bacterium]